jgi:hypothetical protein
VLSIHTNVPSSCRQVGGRAIARLDALAKERGLTRDEVMEQVVSAGLEVEEGNLRRFLETKPSPGSTAP